MEIRYTLKRSRVGRPTEYHNLDALLEDLRKILEIRQKSLLGGKVWLTVEQKPYATPTL